MLYSLYLLLLFHLLFHPDTAEVTEICAIVNDVKGAGTPFSLIIVQFFSQKITGIVLSPHKHGYNTLTGIYLPTLGLI